MGGIAVSISAFLLYLGALLFFKDGIWALSHVSEPMAFLSLPVFWSLYALFLSRIRIEQTVNFYRSQPVHHNFLLAAAAVLSANLFYLFRMQRFLPPPFGNGDSLHLIEYLPVHTALFGYLASFDELLDLFLHSVLYRFSHEAFLWSPETAYAVISAACGGLYVLFFLIFIRDEKRGKFYALSLIFLSPALQLYAGYTENYTIVSLLLSALLFSASSLLDRGFPENRKALYAFSAGMLSALAFLFHIAAGAVLPAMAYFIWKISGNRKDFLRLVFISAGPALALIAFVWGGFYFFMEYPVSPGKSFLFNPPFLRPGSLFSLPHLKDVFYSLIMASPFGIFILAYYVLTGERHSITKMNLGEILRLPLRERIFSACAPEPVHRFLAIAFLSFFGLMFIHNPMIGFPADWDLHTIFHIPLNLYLFYLITQNKEQRFVKERRFLLMAAFLINGFFTAAWIHSNAEGDVLSEGYRISAKITADRTLQSLASDSVFLRLGSPETKRQYADVTQFYLRTRRVLEIEINLMKKQNNTDRRRKSEAVLADLESAFTAYKDLFSKSEFPGREEALLVWEKLSSINVKASEIEKEQIRQYYRNGG